MILKEISKRVTSPPVLVETAHFSVKLAENHEEVEKAQRLRYEVFNLEQGRGLDYSQRFGIDFDEYDEYCLHLLVVNKEDDQIIGTYRAHLGHIANSAKGFYSSREYEIKGLYGIADQCIELGRTCVSPKYRNRIVLSLLWSGIAELLIRAKLTYMLGCVSLESMDAVTGWALYEYLREGHLVHAEFIVKPRPGFVLRRPPAKKIQKLLANKELLKQSIPTLFKGYLRLGAFICGEPALDKEFGTIDFFIMVNINTVPERYLRHFNYRRD
ncbi:MAG: GNAT family N-acyltransferase [Candidatus Omnitrophota bacterium]